jgi:hypothetical protein
MHVFPEVSLTTQDLAALCECAQNTALFPKTQWFLPDLGQFRCFFRANPRPIFSIWNLVWQTSTFAKNRKLVWHSSKIFSVNLQFAEFTVF